ncbi:MAG: outer membrane lipoprotein carrier protein LolA, partial [Nitrospirota bacterium]
MKKQVSVVRGRLSGVRKNANCKIQNSSLFTLHSYLVTAFALFTILCSLSTSVSAAAVDATVASLQKKFESIKDIKGGFIQKSYIKDLEDTQEYSGKFFIKKPSQMMWEYA